ncbi:NLR family CARD domain-containing protein 3-like isoform X2 [Halichoeres trimaculatus]
MDTPADMSEPKQEDETVPVSDTTQSEEEYERAVIKRADSPTPSAVSFKSDMSKGEPVTFKRPDMERANSPTSSAVSLKSDMSKGEPVTFQGSDKESKDSPSPSVLSTKSKMSKGEPVTFKRQLSNSLSDKESEDPPSPTTLSTKSKMSKGEPVTFKRQHSNSQTTEERADPPAPSAVSLQSDMSKGEPVTFKRQHSNSQVDQGKEVFSAGIPDVSAIFRTLRNNIVANVTSELDQFEKALTSDFPECSGNCEDEEDEEGFSGREEILKLTLKSMRRMKQHELADSLQIRTLAPLCQCKLKSNLRQKFKHVFEGIAKSGYPTLLKHMYTELHITEGDTAEVNSEHEVRQIEAASRKQNKPERVIRCEDIFKGSPGTDRPIKMVITKGVAGIGKTILTQNFALKWAEGRANQDIQFIFPFTFKELNVLKDRKYTLVELVQHFFTETKDTGICRFEDFKVLFIFDGLDECRLPLDFNTSEIVTQVTESASVDVLLTSLIRGKLFPTALIWITTRPAAANQVPPGCVDLVTEVRGFLNQQKDEYFMKRFSNKEQARTVISHIKKSRSLHIMCHIPVFCWITATVLENFLETRKEEELPKNFTEMYIEFLVVQNRIKNIKYNGGTETDSWSPENKKMIESLAELAFKHLQDGNLVFYEADLAGCGIDIRAASVYSGVLTQVFREERGLYQTRLFCFVHLSVQEFMAALHVHLTFFKSGVNLLSEEQSQSLWSKLFGDRSEVFYQSAVDKALESPHGHLDLFLRFLVGLSVQTNQSRLKGLLPETKISPQISQRTAQYIKKKISEGLSPERSINLFHCLNELNDHSLVAEIQQSLSSGSLSTENLSPAQWSALVFILLSSEEDLVFDLKKYSFSEETLLKMLPVVKASTGALLGSSNLSKRSCEALSTVLSAPTSNLKLLDLSNNDLKDSGVKLLCTGLESPHCMLEVLRLSGCMITKAGCASLASALKSGKIHLKELDLSYNNPGDSGVKALSDVGKSIATLRLDHGGSQTMKPGLTKYASKLTPDLNTANRKLVLSENNKKLTATKEVQSYPETPERFSYWKQLLCKKGLTGRCYWEVEWSGHVYVAVTYKGIKRKGEGDNSCLGRNDQSWSLSCSNEGYSVLHNNTRTDIHVPTSSRVGVYLDWSAGTLSFYKISDRVTHLHTFSTTFSEPVYPAFRVRMDPFGSSVTLWPT